MLEYFARHPIAANLILIATIWLGISALPNMERESFPEFTSDEVTVTIVYEGASARDVDEEICIPLDDALSAITNLDEMDCLSVEGTAISTLTIVDGADIGQFYNDISSEVSAINDFPTDAEAAQISISGQTEQIALIAVSGIDSLDGLVRYADILADDLSFLPGVASADVLSISDSEYRVQLDQLALRRYAISPADVADAIMQRSLQSPLGTVETSGRDYTLRFSDLRRSVPELENLIILQNAQGGLVRLRDIADVSLAPAEESERAEIDGKRAAIVQVNKNKDDDALDAFAEVELHLEAERAKYPEPFDLTVINNSTEQVAEQIDLVVSNAVQSLILVIIVMFLFFGLIEAFWISLALPFSFLGGFFLLNLFGITINMMSLLALLMSIGLIMDDSIVIAENISKWRAKLPAAEAAVKSVQEVMAGVFSSFLTTAGVFGPLMFLGGESGAILQVIPMVLLVTMSVSLIEAFFILPNHLSHTRGDGTTQTQRVVPRLLDRFKETVVLPIVRVLVSIRYLTVGCVFAVLIVCFGFIASGTIKVVGFPTIENDTIIARISLGSGTQIERTEEVVNQLLDSLEVVNAERTPLTETGEPLVERVLVQYATNADVKDNGEHTVTLIVDLLESALRNVTADTVTAEWRSATGPIADVIQSNFAQISQGPGGNDLDIEIKSDDLIELEAATHAFRIALLERNDVVAAYQDFQGGKPEIQLRLNEFGYTQGMTPQSLANQLRTAFTGTETDSFREGLSSLEVVVQMGDSAANIAELEAFPITLPDGNTVALSRVADMISTEGYSQITRRDGKPTAQILGDIDRTATTSTAISAVALNEIQPVVKADYPGISVAIGGATEDQQETQSSIATALLTGLLVVYLVLAF